MPVYRRNLGDALLESGDRFGAMGAYSIGVTLSDSLVAVNPRDVNTAALKALFLAKLDRADEALASSEQARSINSSSPNILYKHATVLALLGRKSEVLRADVPVIPCHEEEPCIEPDSCTSPWCSWPS